MWPPFEVMQRILAGSVAYFTEFCASDGPAV
jgi:hypothetical protein